MVTKESLLQLERQLWNAGEDFYRRTLNEDAVMVFPEPTGVLERSAILDSLAGADRWSQVDISDVRLVALEEAVAQLIYRADAERRQDSSQYQALITTTYVRENGSWKLLTHQQTPIGD